MGYGSHTPATPDSTHAMSSPFTAPSWFISALAAQKSVRSP